MPIYEYLCDACGHLSEAIQRLSDAPLTECDECGGPVRRLISAPAFQFKGSGWYVTDYAGRKSPESSTAAADSKESAAPAAGTEKSEKKASESGSAKASGKASE